MPIYAYRCDHCGHAKDVLQKLSDPVLTTCPACGTASLRKQVTAAGFQLKGSGWYVTDFRGGNQAAKPDGDGAKPADTPAPPATPSTTATTATAATTPGSSPAPAAPSSSKGSSGSASGTSKGGSSKGGSSDSAPAASGGAASAGH